MSHHSFLLMNRRIPLKILNQTIHQLTLPTPFAVGDVHVYLIKGDMLSLVDAGVKTKEAWESLTHQLKQLGYRPEDIEQLILTHHHPDHIGLIEEFPRLHHISAHKHDVYVEILQSIQYDLNDDVLKRSEEHTSELQ